MTELNPFPQGREDPLPNLPALRSIASLADAKPTVVIDTREQAPLVFARLAAVSGTLYTGDYSFRGGEELFAVERKSIADLVGCCVGENRERFARELHRLRGHRFKRLLIVGRREEIEEAKYRSNVKPKAVLATLGAFEARYDVPVVFAPSPAAAALQVEHWIWWFSRELVEQANDLCRANRTLKPQPNILRLLRKIRLQNQMNQPKQRNRLRSSLPK